MTIDRSEARKLVEASRGRRAMREADAKRVLRGFGLSVPRGIVLPAEASPEGRLKGLSPPYVVKVVAPDILHKSDVGGVAVGLADEAAVSRTIKDMTRRLATHHVEGWIIEEMAPKGVEIVVGATIDRSFGPNVMVGLGGVLVELFEDVSFGICPLRPRDARDMIGALKGARLLRGFRGSPPVDEAALIDVLLRVGGEGGLVPSLSDLVEEIDINPLIVSPRGAVAVDARIILGGSHG